MSAAFDPDANLQLTQELAALLEHRHATPAQAFSAVGALLIEVAAAYELPRKALLGSIGRAYDVRRAR